MDEELQLTDPEHPDAKEAAASTARLLVHLRDKRQRAASADQADIGLQPDEKDDDAQPS